MYRRFLEGDDMVCFDTYDLGRDDFDALMGQPPYPILPQMLENKETISAAVHGCMVNRYIEELGQECSIIRRASASDILARYQHRYQNIIQRLEAWEDHPHERDSACPTEVLTGIIVSKHRLWDARRLSYALDDMRAYREAGTSGLILLLNDRQWSLRQARAHVH